MANKMTGIYKITNCINGKIYVGKSLNISKRWKEHLRHWKCKKHREIPLYSAFGKYGTDNFRFEIIIECKEEELDELEKKYIKQFNTKIDVKGSWGYNVKEGGGGGSSLGSKNGLSKLSEEEVFEIREMYSHLVSKKEAFEFVRGKISINTFSDVWIGKTWKNIHYDVYTEETRRIQRNNFHRGNKYRKISDEVVLKIRNLQNDGLSRGDVFKLLDGQININTFNDVWYGKTFVEISSLKDNHRVKHKRNMPPQDGANNPVAIFSEEEVLFIRREKDSGKKLIDVFLSYKDRVTYACFYNLWNCKTYKKIKEKNESKQD